MREQIMYGVTVTCAKLVHRKDSKVKAIFSVYIGGDFGLKSSPITDTANGAVVINGIKLVRQDSGKYVISYPHMYSGDYVNNLAYPITKPLGTLIENEILRLYKAEVDKMEQIAA